MEHNQHNCQNGFYEVIKKMNWIFQLYKVPENLHLNYKTLLKAVKVQPEWHKRADH